MHPMSGGNGHGDMMVSPTALKSGGSKNDKNKKEGKSDEGDGFSLKMVFSAFASLPRVLDLVWTTNARLTLAMGLISLLRGFSPALSAFITKLVVDSVVAAIQHKGETSTVFWLVGLQLLINVAISFNVGQMYNYLGNTPHIRSGLKLPRSRG